MTNTNATSEPTMFTYFIRQKNNVQFSVRSELAPAAMVEQQKPLGAGLAFMWQVVVVDGWNQWVQVYDMDTDMMNKVAV
jgi:hypothetical protein